MRHIPDPRRSFMVHGATYRDAMEAQRRKQSTADSAINWLADHPRITAIVLAAPIYAAFVLDRILP